MSIVPSFVTTTSRFFLCNWVARRTLVCTYPKERLRRTGAHMASSEADTTATGAGQVRTAAELQKEVLDFWFGSREGLPFYHTFPTHSRRWFHSNPALDAEIAAKFGPDIERAASGDYDDLKGGPTAEGELALVILLDQFTRNVYRGTSRAFAYDEQARAITCSVIAERPRRDVGMMPLMRTFLYMPLMHQESLEEQELCKKLMLEIQEDCLKAPEDQLPAITKYMKLEVQFADKHLEKIKKFGRFPHRNAVLGRESTPGEIEYLKDADRFGQ